MEAIAVAGAAPPADMPAGPPFFQYGTDDEFAALLRGAGLADPAVETIAFTHHLDDLDAFWADLLGGTVRTGPVIKSQTPEVQARIRSLYERNLEPWRAGNATTSPAPSRSAPRPSRSLRPDMPPDLPEKPELRASDADREAVVERLEVAATEGRLDSEELEARVSAAYAARLGSELERLTADITPSPSASAPPTAPPAFVQPGAATRVNPFAIASLVLSILWAFWLGSIAAVVFGHIALRQISRANGTESGSGLAIAGLAFGYIGLVILAVALIFAPPE